MTTQEPNVSKSFWKTLLPILLIVAFTAGGLAIVKKFTSGPRASSGIKIEEGAVVPDFTVTREDGKQVQASELKAKITLVVFWASWCDACRVEMPTIRTLKEKFKDQNFQVIAINVDEHPERVLPGAAREIGIDFPVYIDPDTKVLELFDVHSIPFAVVLDENRKILLIEDGERDWADEEMLSRMARWLGQKGNT